MFSSTVLEVAIGLFFFYLVVSLFTSQIAEGISSLFDYRAQDLRRGIQQLLDRNAGTSRLTAQLYQHPLIRSLFTPKGVLTRALARFNVLRQPASTGDLRPPSYIPAKDFAVALLDQLKLLNQQRETLSTEAQNIAVALNEFVRINKLDPNNPLRRALEDMLSTVDQKSAAAASPSATVLAQTPSTNPTNSDAEQVNPLLTLLKDNPYLQAEFDKLMAGRGTSAPIVLANFQAEIEQWYDAFMQRLSGRYKRNMRWLTFLIGLVLSVLFNLDSLAITFQLWRQPTLRAEVIARAQQEVNLPTTTPETAEAQLQELQALDLPLGWPNEGSVSPDPRVPTAPRGWLYKFLGWLITGFAASQGAPFWFELLGRVVNVRNTGRKPDSPSTDRADR
ncbi:hypothetical protein [Leptolyngbya sp. FACHB-261]|uniref:hypothetical protein n=1 Tax=Leptolyngbya sp. FACHB-261 TaxID=2692806 RepID=UPI00168947EE|nr:hypothetical protein [Leptolyngbya sp. FACHB-261]MBD2103644.1 hypothetical protein [Leptolyngbya sp. FACHB-261]